MIKLLSIILLVLTLVSCSSIKKEIPAGTVVISGKMNPVMGGKMLKQESCWALEVGKDLSSLKYYQFNGDRDLVQRLYEEDAIVTVRVLPRPELKPLCPVGTMVELIEIIEMRSKSD